MKRAGSLPALLGLRGRSAAVFLAMQNSTRGGSRLFLLDGADARGPDRASIPYAARLFGSIVSRGGDRHCRS